MHAGFWRGKRVLVTGHTGFKGAWLSHWLDSMGARVMGYSLAPPTKPSLFELSKLGRRIKSVQGDVRDLKKLTKAVSDFAPAVVFHMAAQSLVRPSYEDPIGTFSTNVMGTAHLLEAVRQHGRVKVVVNVTSDKCYENREWAWGYREGESLGGNDPYSSSKGCSELVTAAYRRSFFGSGTTASASTAIASARAGNVVGGGDWALDRLVPDCIRALSKGEPIVVRSPGAIRPWQHVLEPLSGYVLLAEKLWSDGTEYADAWNFGPQDSDARPVRWIVERIVELWGERARWKLDKREHPHEATWLKLDCSKACARLGWAPRLELDEALEWVVSWHRRLLAGESAAKITLEQIQAYSRLAR